MRSNYYRGKPPARRQRVSNRAVIDQLRTIQQDIRALSARMDSLQRAQQRLALGYIRRSVTFSHTEARRAK